MILTVILVAACGGGDNGGDQAGDFALELFDVQKRGQWGRSWDMLHSKHQEIADRDTYINCNQGDVIGDFDIEVDEVFEETVGIPGLGQLDTTAVTLNLSDEDDSTFITMHTVQEDGDWVWFMSDDAVAAYEAGTCP